MAIRSELRTRSRVRADQDNSTFPDDVAYNYWLDEEAKRTWYELVLAGWPVNFSTVTGTANAQITALAVSGTLAFVRGVYYMQGNTYYELERVQEGQRAALISPNGGTWPCSYEARIDATLGPVLELLPIPSGVSYRVDYIAEYPGFANDAAVWYGPARSDELIVLGVAAKGLKKEGDVQGAASLQGERADLLKDVTAMASWFDQRNPPKIVDKQSMGRLRDGFAFPISGSGYDY